MKLRVMVTVVVVALATLGSARLASARPQSLVITDPTSDVTFDEADEYATRVWNDPWDMSQPTDVRQLDSPGLMPNGFNVFTGGCPAGVWCGQAAVDSPNLALLFPGYQSALHVGRDGNLRPIDTSLYQRLTIRMYIDQVPAGSPGWQVMWTNTDFSGYGSPPNFGQSVLLPLVAGWNVYSIDLSSAFLASGSGSLGWTGNLTGLRLNVGLQNMTGRTVEIDWARLSPQNGDNQLVTWSTTDAGSMALSLISGDNTTTPYHNYTVASGLAQLENISAAAGSYTLQGSLPADNWNIQLQAGADSATSSGRWLIQPTPTLTFVKPSYTSGADYAGTVLGQPWDMSSAGDITLPNIVHHTFSDGILSGQNVNSDPEIVFLPNPLPAQFNIDTSRFRYATFSLSIDGTIDVSNGYITRLFWFTDGAACGETNDIPLHAGFNTVTLDLWANGLLEDPNGACNHNWQASPFRNQFRLDPDEIPAPSPFFHLDYVLLTAMDTASRSGTFPIEYQLGQPSDSVTFYYSTARSLDGRHLANGSLLAPAGTAAFRLFLPLMTRDGDSSLPPGTQTFVWNLAGASAGTYYLSADVSDGIKTVTWFSDAPVVVTP